MATLKSIIEDYLKGEEHTIAAGESLATIAGRFGMSEAQLKAFEGDTGKTNSTRGSAVGDKIIVPKLPANRASSPASITIPSGIDTTMQAQWKLSVAYQNKEIWVAPNQPSDHNLIHMNQRALEHGGTYSWVVAGKTPDLYRTGSGTTGTFSPNIALDPDRFILGTFHTHPYTRFTDGDDNGDVNYSWGDFNYFVHVGLFFHTVQSNKTRFCLIRTKATPARVTAADEQFYNNEVSAVFWKNVPPKLAADRDDFRDAYGSAAIKTATRLNYAIYHGQGTTLNKDN